MDGSFHYNLMSRHLSEGTKEIHAESLGSCCLLGFYVIWFCRQLYLPTASIFRHKSKSLVETEVISYLAATQSVCFGGQLLPFLSYPFHMFSFFLVITSSFSSSPKKELACRLSVFSDYFEIYMQPISIINTARVTKICMQRVSVQTCCQ
jgi:hypothetical protein